MSFPQTITQAQFLEWRKPRIGAANPERLNNPLWEWIIREHPEWSGYEVQEHFELKDEAESHPVWCFQRFGQSTTPLPDGRVVRIAGEHEDYYDPDFFIYNDVTVSHPDGRVDFFGYPEGVFPPTDFHSATLDESRIILIGNLSYPANRRPGFTPVFAVDAGTFEITPVETSGISPGWIYAHLAALSPDGRSIRIEGGKLHHGEPDRSLVENIDVWSLDLESRVWTRLTERKWARFDVRRVDGRRNHLREMGQEAWVHRFPEFRESFEKDVEGAPLPTLEEQLGGPPDLDRFASRYRPPVPHEAAPAKEEEHNVHRMPIILWGRSRRYDGAKVWPVLAHEAARGLLESVSFGKMSLHQRWRRPRSSVSRASPC